MLVAEDNVVNQQVAVGMLEQAGHVVSVAANGREALAVLEKQPFDLVLMDLQMPVLDGFETTAAIRESERGTGGHLPIIAVTAHAMKGDAERCLAAGMDAYVAKPLRSRDLQAAIDAVVSESNPPPPAASPPKSRPGAVVDAPRLLERVSHDRAALGRLVRLFLADYPKQLARIRRAVAERDARGLRAAAHALKGAVSNFAAPAATEAAFRLQQIGDGGTVTGARSALVLLETELARVHEALGALVQEEGREQKRKRHPGRRDGRRRKEKEGSRRGDERKVGPAERGRDEKKRPLPKRSGQRARRR